MAGALEVNETEIETAAESLRNTVAVDVITGAQSLASVGEGGLLLAGGARLFTSAHETRDYLHGPIRALEPGRVGCVVIGDGREVELAATTSLQGCPTLLVTSLGDLRPADHLTVARLPRITGLPAVVLEVLPLQQLTSLLAIRTRSTRRELSPSPGRHQVAVRLASRNCLVSLTTPLAGWCR